MRKYEQFDKFQNTIVLGLVYLFNEFKKKEEKKRKTISD